MIFRNSEGKLIEINRYDFKSDKLYYQKVMDLMNDIKEAKNENKTKNDGSIHKKGIQNRLNREQMDLSRTNGYK
jgi:hypothetical protein